MDKKTSDRLAAMGVQFPQDVFQQLEIYDLLKFWKVGSRNYPNIVDAWIDDDWMCCEYLQLDGFTKTVRYPIVEIDTMEEKLKAAIAQRDIAESTVTRLRILLSDIDASLRSEGFDFELINRIQNEVHNNGR